MVELVQGQVFRSPDPLLRVDNRLAPGTWRFRLVVIDNDGVESAPAELLVRVQQVVVPPAPTTDPPRTVRIPPDVVRETVTVREPVVVREPVIRTADVRTRRIVIPPR